MNTKLSAHRPAKSTLSLIIGLVLTLVISLVPSASAMGETALTGMSPALQNVAQTQPDDPVPLIVQARGSLDDLAAQLQGLGGRVTYQLPMLNALAVEMPVDAMAALVNNPAIARIAADSPIVASASDFNLDLGLDAKKDKPAEPQNTYLDTLNVRPVWQAGVTGKGVGVAVIDSGIANDSEFNKRLVERMGFETNESGTTIDEVLIIKKKKVDDEYGHGTHVAGIIGAEGKKDNGAYAGIAPEVNLISLKIMDDMGRGRTSDALGAVQWILDHKAEYNIRVVNLSVNSADDAYYRDSLMNAAVELLWFNGIVVVASAGNNSAEVLAAPANDPFIITVGASIEQDGNANTPNNRGDDTVANFTGTGTLTYTIGFSDTVEANGMVTITHYSDGFEYAKPDIIAPGKDIVSVLSAKSDWKKEYPDRLVLNNAYFRLSGTSMSAPMVTGAVALLLQDEPGLTPDQVKCRLLDTAGDIQGFAYLDVASAVLATPSDGDCVDGANPNFLVPINTWLEKAVLASNVNWNSVNWNSVNWNSVNWNSVNWNSVNWNSVNWNSVNWNSVNWNSVNWNSVNWNSVSWDD